jgi:hypothetical protein
MAAEVQFGGSVGDRVFIGTDLTKKFHVKDYDTDATGATAKDITGWAITFDARRRDASDTVLLSKALTITGSFNSVASSNTQRALLTLLDTELITDKFTSNGGTFRYSVKRTDNDAETILAYGDFVVERATQIL